MEFNLSIKIIVDETKAGELSTDAKKKLKDILGREANKIIKEAHKEEAKSREKGAKPQITDNTILKAQKKLNNKRKNNILTSVLPKVISDFSMVLVNLSCNGLVDSISLVSCPFVNIWLLLLVASALIYGASSVFQYIPYFTTRGEKQ